MQQLTFIEPGRLEWRDAPEPRLEGDRPGARAAARRRDLRPRPCDRPRRVPYRARSRSATSASPRWSTSATRSARSRPATSSASPSRSPAASAPPAARADGQLRRRRRRWRCTGCRSAAAGAASSPIVVRVPYADAMLVPLPDRRGAGGGRRASRDNILDAWRTVGPQLAERPGAPVLICAGAGSIDVYAAAIALALGAERVDFAGGRPGMRRARRGLRRDLVDERLPGAARALPDHGRRERRATTACACALRSTAPDGHLHQRRHLLRAGDPGAAARDVHEGDHLPAPAACTPARRSPRCSS